MLFNDSVQFVTVGTAYQYMYTNPWETTTLLQSDLLPLNTVAPVRQMHIITTCPQVLIT